MPQNKQKIFAVIAEHQQQLRDLGVLKLELFGSAARNETKEDSDLDFLLVLKENTFDAYMGVKLLLEDLFECSVDLVLRDSIKSRLRDHVLQEAINAPGF